MSSQITLGQQQQAHHAASPTASSAGSNQAVSSPTQDSNRSGTPGSNRGGSSASAASAAAQKQVLTEEQKKANHIASEKKRRNNIREQYDKLAEMIPGMAGQGRSEGRVLEEAVKMATQLVQERENIIAEIKAKGGTVDPKLYEEIDKALKVIRDNTLHTGRSDSQGEGRVPEDQYYTAEPSLEMYPTPPGTGTANIVYGVDPRFIDDATRPWPRLPPPPPTTTPPSLLRQSLDPYARFAPHDQRVDHASSRPTSYHPSSSAQPLDSFNRGVYLPGSRLTADFYPHSVASSQTFEVKREGSENFHSQPVL